MHAWSKQDRYSKLGCKVFYDKFYISTPWVIQYWDETMLAGHSNEVDQEPMIAIWEK